MSRVTLRSRRCPSCLRSWRSGYECKNCGYSLGFSRRMPTIGEILAGGDAVEWDAVDLSAWSRMIWRLARGTR